MDEVPRWQRTPPQGAYSRADAAKLLGWNPKTVRSHLQNGRLARSSDEKLEVDGASVEEKRAALLSQLGAIDARPGVRTPDPPPDAKPGAAKGTDAAESDLRRQLLRAQTNGRAVATMLRTALDALGDAFVPDDPELANALLNQPAQTE